MRQIGHDGRSEQSATGRWKFSVWPGGYDAQRTARAVTEALARQPEHMVKTLTWDQGREMARWADIEKSLAITVYFCEPRSPWQQPANEQTNGLLRRWLPKSTDLDINPVRLAVIEDHLNTMPRKLHNWDSAQTAYMPSAATTDRACRPMKSKLIAQATKPTR